MSDIPEGKMRGRIEPTLAPSLARYRRLFRSEARVSITRALQYEALAAAPISGDVLDVGGGQRAGYRKLVRCDRYDSVNINSRMEPTWVVGVGERFPVEEDRYDVVLSMNTLEHVFDARFLISEMFRALRAGGQLVCAAPFLFPIHGAPDDFFRPSPSWYFHCLSNIGFKDVVVKPLVWGPFSTGYICSGAPGPFKGARKHMVLLGDLLYASARSRARSAGAVSDGMTRVASAFFVTARK